MKRFLHLEVPQDTNTELVSSGLLALSTSNVWIVHLDSPCGQSTWTSAGDHHLRWLNLQEKVGRGTLDLELSLDSYSGAPRGPRASPGPHLGLQRNVTNLLAQGSTSYKVPDEGVETRVIYRPKTRKQASACASAATTSRAASDDSWLITSSMDRPWPFAMRATRDISSRRRWVACTPACQGRQLHACDHP